MFKKHDKVLFIAQIIFWIDTAIIALGSIIGGIWIGVATSNLSCLWLIFGGLWGSFIHWVFTTLFISFLKDVKLIRNKLYGEGIEGLEIGVDKQKEEIIEQKEEVVEHKEEKKPKVRVPYEDED